MYMRMKRNDGVLVSSKEEIKGAWNRHFKYLMNEKTHGKAIAPTNALISSLHALLNLIYWFSHADQFWNILQ